VDARLDAVRELWSTYREQGPDVALKLLDPDVEFVAHDGRSYRGHAGVERFFAEFVERGERFMASIYTFELHEPDVMVVGYRRIRSGDGTTRGDYLFFVHSFNDGRVSRIAAHLSREAALAEIAQRASPA